MDIHKDCIWQTRAEMDAPTNPLQAIHESYGRSSKDMSEQKFDAWMYGVVVGWDDKSYEQLQKQHGWTNDQVAYQKKLHQNYIKAWNLFMQSENKK